MASAPAKKNTAFTFPVSLPSQAGSVYQVNPTLAAGDVQVSIDGGSFVNIDSLPVAIDSGSTLTVSLLAAEMNGDWIRVAFHDAAGAEWCDVSCDIFTVTQQIDDLASQASVNAIDAKADDIAPIKAKTDSLTFTVAGKVNANIQSVNNVTVTGTGTAGDEWGP